jgi:hypothetical protein
MADRLLQPVAEGIRGVTLMSDNVALRKVFGLDNNITHFRKAEGIFFANYMLIASGLLALAATQ